MSAIPDTDAHFARGCGRCARFDTPNCSARTWAEGLAVLRQVCLDAGLTETLKWAHPCYVQGSRNIAIIGAFRSDFRLSFFEAGLLSDPAGLLTRQGPNTPHPDAIRFTSAAEVIRLAPDLNAYLTEAMDHAAAGRRAPRDGADPDWPTELIDALDADAELAQAFDALTPGRRKSYLLNLNAARKPETRTTRIEKFRSRIIAGKGANEY